MSFLGNIDYEITKAATEVAQDQSWHDAVVYAFAELVPYLFILAAILIFFSGRTQRQKEKAGDTVLAAFGAVLLAIGARWLLGEVYFRERPFVTHQLDYLKIVSEHANSFPSLHAMMLFAFAGTVKFIGNFPRWGTVLLVMAAVCSIARVFAGVHYPIDIIAGAVLGLGIAKLVSWQSQALAKDMR